MKKINLLILHVFIFSTFLHAQPWSELGTGAQSLAANNRINAVVTDNAGNVYAAGAFTNADGYYYVAKWDGSVWTELGQGSNSLKANGLIRALVIDANDNLYAAGYFRDLNGYEYVAKWNGTTWSSLGTGANAMAADDWIRCLAVDKAGNVYAGGHFKLSNDYLGHENCVAKWNGTSWAELRTNNSFLDLDYVFTIAVEEDNGYVFAAGDDDEIGVWDGTQWGYLNPILYGSRLYYAMKFDHADNLYIGGEFQDETGKTCLTKWDGTGFSRPGETGSNGMNANNYVQTLAVDDADNVYAGGYFTDASNKQYIAKWNGTNWIELGTGTTALNANDNIYSVTTDKSGNVYTAGDFTNAAGKMYVAKWNAAVPTGILTAAATIDVVLYPNPSAGTFSIQTKELVQSVTITNSLGQQEECTTGTEITTSFSGIVFVDIHTASGRTVKKMIIK